MKYRRSRRRIKKPSPGNGVLRNASSAIVSRIQQSLPDRHWEHSRKSTWKNYGTTRSIYRSKPRQDPLFSPYSKTVLRRRFPQTMGALVGNVRRDHLLGRSRGPTGKRNHCTSRAARKAVLFTKRLIGYSGSSPGRRGKYRRTQDSQFSCK